MTQQEAKSLKEFVGQRCLFTTRDRYIVAARLDQITSGFAFVTPTGDNVVSFPDGKRIKVVEKGTPTCIPVSSITLFRLVVVAEAQEEKETEDDAVAV